MKPIAIPVSTFILVFSLRLYVSYTLSFFFPFFFCCEWLCVCVVAFLLYFPFTSFCRHFLSYGYPSVVRAHDAPVPPVEAAIQKTLKVRLSQTVLLLFPLYICVCVCLSFLFCFVFLSVCFFYMVSIRILVEQMVHRGREEECDVRLCKSLSSNRTVV